MKKGNTLLRNKIFEMNLKTKSNIIDIKAFTIAFILSIFVIFSSNVNADEGDTIFAGVTGIPATFIDNQTNRQFNVIFSAEEWENGAGEVKLFIWGNDLSMCSTRGPGAKNNTYPLRDIQCGTAKQMSVSIKDNSADVTLHGYIHSDHPFVTYMGQAIFDISVKSLENNVHVMVIINTPKEKIILSGNITE